MIGAGTLQHQVDIQGGPIDALGGGAAQDLHAVTIDMQTVAVDLHVAGESAVSGVEACQVFHTGLVGQVVQRHDFEASLCPTLKQCAQDTAADAAVTVECNLVGTRVGH
ncbi:hypothetical protein D3C73_1431170 [compost metagenome]